MKNYVINVNGVSYNVSVEEVGSGNNSISNSQSTPVISPSAPQPTQADRPNPSDNGNYKHAIKAGVPGKVTQILVSPNQTIKENENVLMVEAMKMEIPVVSEVAGTVAGINVSVGQVVEAGEILVTLN